MRCSCSWSLVGGRCDGVQWGTPEHLAQQQGRGAATDGGCGRRLGLEQGVEGEAAEERDSSSFNKYHASEDYM